MSDLSAHDAAATVICNVAGCVEEARPNGPPRGPYSCKCEYHYQAQRRRFAVMGRGQPDPGLSGAADPLAPVEGCTCMTVEQQKIPGMQHRDNCPARTRSPHAPEPHLTVVSEPGSYQERAVRLVGLAKRVDRAIADTDRARERCAPALRRVQEKNAAADQLREEFRAAVRELLEP